MHLGYHASHEQFSPRDLLHYIQLAEQAGFTHAMSSEHIAPWSVRQGQSGNAWAWLGAALQATNQMKFGCLAIPGASRYHPTVVAHVFATLAQMFPSRFGWIAVGSGEAMNEHVTAAPWPDKDTRQNRLKAGVDIIRGLWDGQTVTQSGQAIDAHEARLYSLPEVPPRIFGAALSVETAGWMREWADGLITVRADKDHLKNIVQAFRGASNAPVALQFQLSWADTQEQARSNAHDQWRHVAATTIDREALQTPEQFDAACDHIQPSDMEKHMLITHDPADIIAELKTYADLGFSEIYLHNAGRNQEAFIAMCRDHILPACRRLG